MSEIKPICWESKQDFVDCMFVNSPCVQSGRKSFKECMDEESKDRTINLDCVKLYREYRRCLERAIDTRSRFRGNI